MKYTIPIERLIESSIEVDAESLEEAKTTVKKLLADGLDIDDEKQYWNDWEVADNE